MGINHIDYNGEIQDYYRPQLPDHPIDSTWKDGMLEACEYIMEYIVSIKKDTSIIKKLIKKISEKEVRVN